MKCLLKLGFPGCETTYDSRDSDVYIIGKDRNRIVVKFDPFKLKDTASMVIIYFHGNSEDIGYSGYMLEETAKRLNAVVLTVEYPGYGTYKWASVSEKRIKHDAEQVYRFLTDEIGIHYSNIMIAGRSM